MNLLNSFVYIDYLKKKSFFGKNLTLFLQIKINPFNYNKRKENFNWIQLINMLVRSKM